MVIAIEHALEERGRAFKIQGIANFWCEIKDASEEWQTEGKPLHLRFFCKGENFSVDLFGTEEELIKISRDVAMTAANNIRMAEKRARMQQQLGREPTIAELYNLPMLPVPS